MTDGYPRRAVARYQVLSQRMREREIPWCVTIPTVQATMRTPTRVAVKIRTGRAARRASGRSAPEPGIARTVMGTVTCGNDQGCGSSELLGSTISLIRHTRHRLARALSA